VGLVPLCRWDYANPAQGTISIGALDAPVPPFASLMKGTDEFDDVVFNCSPSESLFMVRMIVNTRTG
jgi:hypothetical protein